MNAAPATAKKSRGIIVFDACEFQSLGQGLVHTSPSAQISAIDSNLHAFTNLLPMLAQHGFSVIIPEMVALEAGDTLANARTLHNFFPHCNELYPGEANVRAFMRKAALGEYPGVELRANTQENTDYGKLLTRMNIIVRSHPSMHIKYEIAHKDVALASVRTQLRDVRNEINTRDFGEKHGMDIIASEIETQRKNKTHIPIFFATTDKEARHKLHQQLVRTQRPGDPVVNAIVLSGMLDALEQDKATLGGRETNALEMAGFHAGSTVLWHWMYDAMQGRSYGSVRTPHPKDVFVDTAIGLSNPDHRPFRDAVRGMAQDMIDARAPEAQAPKSANPANDRIARYQAQLAAARAKQAQTPTGGRQ